MPFSSEHFIIQPLLLKHAKVSSRLYHVLLEVAKNSIKTPNTPNPNLTVL